MIKQYIEVGKIVGTHALKGEVRVECWCDNPEFICKFKNLYNSDGSIKYKVLKAKVHKNVAILLLEGVNTIEEADKQRGKILYIKRQDAKLDKDAYFIQDLIGMTVVDNSDNNIIYGKITDIFKTGANDVYQVTKDNKDYLIPAIPQVIIDIDIENLIMKIEAMKGIFDDED